MKASQIMNIAYATARIGIGVVATAYPEKIGRTWIGQNAESPNTQVILRGLGARDLALGAGTIDATVRGEGAATWLATSALADLGDLIATLVGREALPKNGVLVTSFLAGSGAITGAALLALDRGRE
jgi:hypothetical protein